jgi:hypothetical protein
MNVRQAPPRFAVTFRVVLSPANAARATRLAVENVRCDMSCRFVLWGTLNL